MNPPILTLLRSGSASSAKPLRRSASVRLFTLVTRILVLISLLSLKKLEEKTKPKSEDTSEKNEIAGTYGGLNGFNNGMLNWKWR